MKIQPDKQFRHSTSIIDELAAHYGFTVADYTEASSGIENTTLLVRSTNDQRYAMRIYRQDKKSDGQIVSELNFMAYLRQNGIPLPDIILNTQNQAITLLDSSDNTWQVIAMEHIDGEHINKPSAELLSDIATTQATMHLLANNYPTSNENIRIIDKLTETEFIQQIDIPKLPVELQQFLHRGADYEVSFSGELPIGPCHFDYDEQNILCRNNAIVAVLDFDDLSIAPYVVCLAYTLWHISDSIGLPAMEAYLAIYEQLRPLSVHERQVLYKAVLFRHYMISAIKILNGETSSGDIQSYLSIEHYFMSNGRA